MIKDSHKTGFKIKLISAICGLISLTIINGLTKQNVFFQITAVDESTGRGIPLVEFKTINNISHFTDSLGNIAFFEPGLMNQKVFFFVKSDGYVFPKDGFGFNGLALETVPGSNAVIKLKRVNIAARLYRITGQGIYRDSTLLGLKVPLKNPNLNGRVLGQDSVLATVYNGRIFWFWGDTDSPSYPLGNFAASGATSLLPDSGGLNPDIGIDLNYFVDSSGFAKQMCPFDEPGMKWIAALFTTKDNSNNERLLAQVACMRDLNYANSWVLAVFNDEKTIFEPVIKWNLHNGHKISHPVQVASPEINYWYLFPNLRVKNNWNAITNMNEYENFTALQNSDAFVTDKFNLERDSYNNPVYKWRKGISPLDPEIEDKLIKKGIIHEHEHWRALIDIDTAEKIHGFSGSIAWNQYRQRWIMIFQGSLNNVWYSEADTPVGPWVYAKKIITHENYSFYNPVHHAFFDQDQGKIIYIEGTYTDTFSKAQTRTPRYNYNQIMYKLDLLNHELAIPTPLYLIKTPHRSTLLMTRNEIQSQHLWKYIIKIPFLALPGDCKKTGLIPVSCFYTNNTIKLVDLSKSTNTSTHPMFYALPLNLNNQTNDLHKLSSSVKYLPFHMVLFDDASVEPIENNNNSTTPEYPETHKNRIPIGIVWKYPLSSTIADFETARPTH